MTQPATGQYPCVIAVDDDVTMRELISRYLTQAGFSVVPCSCGAEMWAALAAYPPGLVLLDIELAGEDGLALAEELRAKYGFGLPVVMLTGVEEGAAKAMAYDVGADDYLTKPCDWRRLVAIVSRFVSAAVS
ncbi:hypothetical protein CU669_17235 [Paramagnetospirillum kuznetsovii]|uniref:Response regulatory domain-containing protein n=1 Tax=Paramagnetospirillum kuznetsovii TaxID=2053833 RepID=A0A364NUD4_9PROT|nr:response regulator [Paramagnetospirillum kuznetsovii]RAU20684.1 hypothetical protein CU669_17235 [Paramagnetospirillum kuznetsovii]